MQKALLLGTLCFLACLHLQASALRSELRADLTASASDPNAAVNRGDLLFCNIQYFSKGVHPRQHLINLQHLDSYRANKHNVECFTGGRGNHRTNYLAVPYGADVSLDYGLNIHTRKTEDTTTLEGTNTRSESVIVTLVVWGTDIVMSRDSPIRRILEGRETLDLVTVSLAPNATDPVMQWKWRAEPLFYHQLRSLKTISSNGIYLSISNHKNYTDFTVINNRYADGIMAVHFKLEVFPQGGTNWDNLLLTKPGTNTTVDKTAYLTIRPRHKVHLLRVAPANIRVPWVFGFTYSWTSGTSPKELFGTTH